jgi:hypothetical protein
MLPVGQGVELTVITRLHVEKAVDALLEESGELHSRETIERIMDDLSPGRCGGGARCAQRSGAVTPYERGPATRMRGVVKRYGPIAAVDGLDLDVPVATCVGLDPGSLVLARDAEPPKRLVDVPARGV